MLNRMNQEPETRLETLATTEIRDHRAPAANQANAAMHGRRLRRQRRENAGQYRSGLGWGVSLW